MTTFTVAAPEITQTLHRIIKNEPASIRAFVAQEALDYPPLIVNEKLCLLAEAGNP